MKALLSVVFHSLPIGAHLQFFKTLRDRILAASDAFKAIVEPYMDEFNAWIDEEEAVFRWMRKSDYTKQIAVADKDMERLLVGINDGVDQGRHSTMSAIKASGDKVYNMMQDFGYIPRKSYTLQSADISALLEKLNGPYEHDRDNLGIGMWVQQLYIAYAKFLTLLNQRDSERVEKPPFTGKETRKALENAYRPIEKTINANAITSASTEFALFIDYMNPIITRINAEFHRVRTQLTLHNTLVDIVQTQLYTGRAVTPVPNIYFRTDEKTPVIELALGKDFFVTYKNNIEVGQAELTIHGKGKYKGTLTVSFHIAREPFPS